VWGGGKRFSLFIMCDIVAGKLRLWLRKKSNFCVALHPSSLQRTVSTPHSSGFARLEFGAFSFAIGF